jgi:hypothetical protein
VSSRVARSGLGLAALALCLGLPLALGSARAHLVPMGDGLWHGLTDPPGLARIALAAVAGLGVALLARGLAPGARKPLLALGLAGAPLLAAAFGRWPALLVPQGPALALVALPALFVVIARSATLPAGFRARGPVLVAVGFLFYAALGARLPGPAGPQGDEPHYLTMAESLLSDGDLDLSDEFAERAYAPFFAGTLAPHRSPASPRGRLYAVHAPGLPVLILPAYATGGYPAVRLFLSLLAAVASALAWRLSRDVTGSEATALGAWAALTFTPPLPFYAVAVYPETPAALAVAAFLLLARGEASGGRLALAALLASTLPWLHPKFLPLGLLGLGLVLIRGRFSRAAMAASALAAASIAALLAWFAATFGRASLAAAYGPGPDVDWLNLPRGTLALLLDRQFGLLPLAPLWLLAAPGLVLLLRRGAGDGLRVLLLAGVVVAAGASFGMWWGGACPPARFLVPAMPALAVALAPSLSRRPGLAASLLGFGVAVVGIAAWAPRAIHNFPDGDSALWRTLSPAVSVDALLPSFVVGPGELLLGLSLLAAALVAWRSGFAIAAAVAGAYLLLATSITGGARLEPGPATVALLTAWDEGNLASAGPSLDIARLAIPAGERRRLRGLDLPAGLYDAEVSTGIAEAGSRVRLRADELPLLDEALASGSTRWPLLLPAGARRLTLELPAGARAAFVPRALVPRGRRDSFAWPLVPWPDRYRVGGAALRITTLDRSEPEGGGFRLDGAEGRFLVELPEGGSTRLLVQRASPPARGDCVLWGDREIDLSGMRAPALDLPAQAGLRLGGVRVVPLRVRASGALVSLSSPAQDSQGRPGLPK